MQLKVRLIAFITVCVFSATSVGARHALPLQPPYLAFSPTVYLIQDAHDSLDAQESIRSILKDLVEKEKVSMVCFEGGSLELDRGFYNFTRDAKKNEVIWDQLAKEGEISGLERYALEAPRSVRFFGIEDEEVYFQNLNAIRKVYSEEAKNQPSIWDIEDKFTKERGRYLTGDLKKLIDARRAFDEKRLDLQVYGRELTKWAQKVLKLDLTDPRNQDAWPQMVRLVKLGEMKVKGSRPISFPYVKGHLRWYFERLVDEGIELDKDWIGFQVLQDELEPAGLFEEIERLEKQILDGLKISKETREFLARDRAWQLTKKLIRLELTRREWEEVVGARHALPLQIEAAKNNYRLVTARDRILTEKTKERLAKLGGGKAAVVVGGFHTSEFEKFLKAQGIEYAVVNPTIRELTRKLNYRKRVTRDQTAPPVWSAVRNPRALHVQHRLFARAASLGETLLVDKKPIKTALKQDSLEWFDTEVNGRKVNLLEAITEGSFRASWLAAFKPLPSRDTYRLKDAVELLEMDSGDILRLARPRGAKLVGRDWSIPVSWLKTAWDAKKRLVPLTLLSKVLRSHGQDVSVDSLRVHCEHPEKHFGLKTVQNFFNDRTSLLETSLRGSIYHGRSNHVMVDILTARELVEIIKRSFAQRIWDTARTLAAKIGVKTGVIRKLIKQKKIKAEWLRAFSEMDPHYRIPPKEAEKVIECFREALERYRTEVGRYTDEKIGNWQDLRRVLSGWDALRSLKTQWGFRGLAGVHRLIDAGKLKGIHFKYPFSDQGKWYFPPEEVRRAEQARARGARVSEGSSLGRKSGALRGDEIFRTEIRWSRHEVEMFVSNPRPTPEFDRWIDEVLNVEASLIRKLCEFALEKSGREREIYLLPSVSEFRALLGHGESLDMDHDKELPWHRLVASLSTVWFHSIPNSIDAYVERIRREQSMEDLHLVFRAYPDVEDHLVIDLIDNGIGETDVQKTDLKRSSDQPYLGRSGWGSRIISEAAKRLGAREELLEREDARGAIRQIKFPWAVLLSLIDKALANASSRGTSLGTSEKILSPDRLEPMPDGNWKVIHPLLEEKNILIALSRAQDQFSVNYSPGPASGPLEDGTPFYFASGDLEGRFSLNEKGEVTLYAVDGTSFHVSKSSELRYQEAGGPLKPYRQMTVTVTHQLKGDLNLIQRFEFEIEVGGRGEIRSIHPSSSLANHRNGMEYPLRNMDTVLGADEDAGVLNVAPGTTGHPGGFFVILSSGGDGETRLVLLSDDMKLIREIPWPEELSQANSLGKAPTPEELGQALHKLEQGLAVNPNDLVLKTQKAQVLMTLGRIREAEGLIQDVPFVPKNVATVAVLANIRDRLGQSSEAQALWTRVNQWNLDQLKKLVAQLDGLKNPESRPEANRIINRIIVLFKKARFMLIDPEVRGIVSRVLSEFPDADISELQSLLSKASARSQIPLPKDSSQPPSPSPKPATLDREGTFKAVRGELLEKLAGWIRENGGRAKAEGRLTPLILLEFTRQILAAGKFDERLAIIQALRALIDTWLGPDQSKAVSSRERHSRKKGTGEPERVRSSDRLRRVFAEHDELNGNERSFMASLTNPKEFLRELNERESSRGDSLGEEIDISRKAQAFIRQAPSVSVSRERIKLFGRAAAILLDGVHRFPGLLKRAIFMLGHSEVFEMMIRILTDFPRDSVGGLRYFLVDKTREGKSKARGILREIHRRSEGGSRACSLGSAVASASILELPQSPTGRVYYPASGFDVRTVADVLRIFPHLTEIWFVDPAYQTHPKANIFSLRRDGYIYSKNHVRSLLSRGLIQNGFDVDKEVRYPKGERLAENETITLTFRNRSGKARNLIVFAGTYESFREVNSLRFDVAIVKAPGFYSSLSSHPKFWEAIAYRLQSGGYVTVRQAYVNWEPFTVGFVPVDQEILAKVNQLGFKDPFSSIWRFARSPEASGMSLGKDAKEPASVSLTKPKPIDLTTLKGPALGLLGFLSINPELVSEMLDNLKSIYSADAWRFAASLMSNVLTISSQFKLTHDQIQIFIRALKGSYPIQTRAYIEQAIARALVNDPQLLPEFLAALKDNPTLSHLLEPLALSKPESVRFEQIRQMYRDLKTNPGLKYPLYYLTGRFRAGVPPALSPYFPHQEKVRRLLAKGEKNVLVVHNIRDGLGDELILNATLIQGLLDLNPKLKVILYTDKGFLYDHPRVETHPVTDNLDIEHGKSRFDMVIYHRHRHDQISESLDTSIRRRIRAQASPIYLETDNSSDRFVFDRISVDRMNVEIPKRLKNSYSSLYRLCAELGLPFQVGSEMRQDSLLVANSYENANRWWQEHVARNNSHPGRPVAILNGFGGEYEEKGFTRVKNDIFVWLIKSLIELGLFVVVLPNHQSWGTQARALEVIGSLPQEISKYVVVAPEPDRDPRLHKYLVEKASMVITVEGGLMHLAYHLGKPLWILYSHGSGEIPRWLPMALSPDQFVFFPFEIDGLDKKGQVVIQKSSPAASGASLGIGFRQAWDQLIREYDVDLGYLSKVERDLDEDLAAEACDYRDHGARQVSHRPPLIADPSSTLSWRTRDFYELSQRIRKAKDAKNLTIALGNEAYRVYEQLVLQHELLAQAWNQAGITDSTRLWNLYSRGLARYRPHAPPNLNQGYPDEESAKEAFRSFLRHSYYIGRFHSLYRSGQLAPRLAGILPPESLDRFLLEFQHPVEYKPDYAKLEGLPQEKQEEFQVWLRQGLLACFVSRCLEDHFVRAAASQGEIGDIQALVDFHRDLGIQIRDDYRWKGENLKIEIDPELGGILNYHFQFDIPGPLRRRDPVRGIWFVLYELLENAFQTGSEVTFRAANIPDQHQIEIQVEDHSAQGGLETLQGMFRWRKSTKPPGEGEGIGLFQSELLIHFLGGNIEVISKKKEEPKAHRLSFKEGSHRIQIAPYDGSFPEQGTRVVIRLPIWEEKPAEGASLGRVLGKEKIIPLFQDFIKSISAHRKLNKKAPELRGRILLQLEEAKQEFEKGQFSRAARRLERVEADDESRRILAWNAFGAKVQKIARAIENLSLPPELLRWMKESTSKGDARRNELEAILTRHYQGLTLRRLIDDMTQAIGRSEDDFEREFYWIPDANRMLPYKLVKAYREGNLEEAISQWNSVPFHRVGPGHMARMIHHFAILASGASLGEGSEDEKKKPDDGKGESDDGESDDLDQLSDQELAKMRLVAGLADVTAAILRRNFEKAFEVLKAFEARWGNVSTIPDPHYSIFALSMKAEIYMGLKKYEDAVRCWTDYIQKVESSDMDQKEKALEKAFHRRADAYKAMEERGLAEKDYERALRMMEKADLSSPEEEEEEEEFAEGGADEEESEDLDTEIDRKGQALYREMIDFLKARKYGDAWRKYQELERLLSQTEFSLDWGTLMMGITIQEGMENRQGAILLLNSLIEEVGQEESKDTDAMNVLQEALVKRGIIYAKNNQPEEAISDFTRALQLGADPAPALFRRGFAYALASRWKQAIADFENSSAQFEPQSMGRMQALEKWAYSLQELGDWEEARKILDVARAEYPVSPVLDFLAARESLRKENLRQALKRANAAIEKAPLLGMNTHPYLIFRAVIYDRLGRRDDAIKDLETAQGKDTFDAHARSALAVLLEERGDSPRAHGELDAARFLNPSLLLDLSLGSVNLGKWLRLRPSPGRLIERWTREIERIGENLSASERDLSALYTHRAYGHLEIYRRAAKKSLSMARSPSPRLRSARKDFKEALRWDPENQDAKFGLAILDMVEGRNLDILPMLSARKWPEAGGPFSGASLGKSYRDQAQRTEAEVIAAIKKSEASGTRLGYTDLSDAKMIANTIMVRTHSNEPIDLPTREQLYATAVNRIQPAFSRGEALEVRSEKDHVFDPPLEGETKDTQLIERVKRAYNLLKASHDLSNIRIVFLTGTTNPEMGNFPPGDYVLAASGFLDVKARDPEKNYYLNLALVELAAQALVKEDWDRDDRGMSYDLSEVHHFLWALLDHALIFKPDDQNPDILHYDEARDQEIHPILERGFRAIKELQNRQRRKVSSGSGASLGISQAWDKLIKKYKVDLGKVERDLDEDLAAEARDYRAHQVSHRPPLIANPSSSLSWRATDFYELSERIRKEKDAKNLTIALGNEAYRVYEQIILQHELLTQAWNRAGITDSTRLLNLYSRGLARYRPHAPPNLKHGYPDEESAKEAFHSFLRYSYYINRFHSLHRDNQLAPRFAGILPSESLDHFLLEFQPPINHKPDYDQLEALPREKQEEFQVWLRQGLKAYFILSVLSDDFMQASASRGKAGYVQILEYPTLDLRIMIRDIVLSPRGIGRHLKIEIAPELGFFLNYRFDHRTAIGVVLSELFSNAFQTGSEVTFRAANSPDQHQIEIQVEDHSAQGGLESLQGMFRWQKSTKPEKEGAGIGLFQSETIVHFLGGNIEVISKKKEEPKAHRLSFEEGTRRARITPYEGSFPEQGTRFVVTLPVWKEEGVGGASLGKRGEKPETSLLVRQIRPGRYVVADWIWQILFVSFNSNALDKAESFAKKHGITLKPGPVLSKILRTLLDVFSGQLQIRPVIAATIPEETLTHFRKYIFEQMIMTISESKKIDGASLVRQFRRWIRKGMIYLSVTTLASPGQIPGILAHEELHRLWRGNSPEANQRYAKGYAGLLRFGREKAELINAFLKERSLRPPSVAGRKVKSWSDVLEQGLAKAATDTRYTFEEFWVSFMDAVPIYHPTKGWMWNSLLIHPAIYHGYSSLFLAAERLDPELHASLSLLLQELGAKRMGAVVQAVKDVKALIALGLVPPDIEKQLAGTGASPGSLSGASLGEGKDELLSESFPPEIRSQFGRDIWLWVFDKDQTLTGSDTDIDRETSQKLTGLVAMKSDVDLAIISSADFQNVDDRVTQHLDEVVRERLYVYGDSRRYLFDPRVSPLSLADQLVKIHETLREVLKGVSPESIKVQERGAQIRVVSAELQGDLGVHVAWALRKRLEEKNLFPDFLSLKGGGLVIGVTVGDKKEELLHLVGEIAEKRGVTVEEVLRHTAVLGNSIMDVPMLNTVAKAGGTALYVGDKGPQGLFARAFRFLPRWIAFWFGVEVLYSKVLRSPLVGPAGANAALQTHLDWQDLSVRLAEPKDIKDIVNIQANSPAKSDIWLTLDQVSALVSNRQVFLAEARIKEGKEKIPAGVVFFTHSKPHPASYDDVRNPRKNDSDGGQYLYDFWILVHKQRRYSEGGKSLATELLKATGVEAARLGKKGPIAYSRASGALSDIYEEFKKGAETQEDFYLRIKDNHLFKAALLVRYLLETRAPTDPRETPSSPLPFLDWAEAKAEFPSDTEFIEILKQLIRNPETLKINIAEDDAFIQKLGLRLRRFLDETKRLLADRTIGELHSRRGARLIQVKLGSRPGDPDALDSNILMSYEGVSLSGASLGEKTPDKKGFASVIANLLIKGLFGVLSSSRIRIRMDIEVEERKEKPSAPGNKARGASLGNHFIKPTIEKSLTMFSSGDKIDQNLALRRIIFDLRTLRKYKAYPKELFQKVTSILTSRSITDHLLYKETRTELMKWLLYAGGDFRRQAQVALELLRENILKYLGPNEMQATDDATERSYGWRDVMNFKEDTDVGHINLMEQALEQTLILKEAIFLMYGERVNLRDIEIGGIEVYELGRGQNKVVYGVNVRTKGFRNYDFAINIYNPLTWLGRIHKDLNYADKKVVRNFLETARANGFLTLVRPDLRESLGDGPIKIEDESVEKLREYQGTSTYKLCFSLNGNRHELNLDQDAFMKGIVGSEVAGIIEAGTMEIAGEGLYYPGRVTKTIEDFGGLYEEYSMWSEELIKGKKVLDMLQERMTQREGESHPEWITRVQILRPYIFWRAIDAYFDLYNRIDWRWVILDPLPQNVLIPETEYMRDARVIDVGDRVAFRGYAEAIVDMSRHFFRGESPSERLLGMPANWIIFSAFLDSIMNSKAGEMAGDEALKYGVSLLQKATAELRQKIDWIYKREEVEALRELAAKIDRIIEEAKGKNEWDIATALERVSKEVKEKIFRYLAAKGEELQGDLFNMERDNAWKTLAAEIGEIYERVKGQGKEELAREIKKIHKDLELEGASRALNPIYGGGGDRGIVYKNVLKDLELFLQEGISQYRPRVVAFAEKAYTRWLGQNHDASDETKEAMALYFYQVYGINRLAENYPWWGTVYFKETCFSDCSNALRDALAELIEIQKGDYKRIDKRELLDKLLGTYNLEGKEAYYLRQMVAKELAPEEKIAKEEREIAAPLIAGTRVVAGFYIKGQAIHQIHISKRAFKSLGGKRIHGRDGRGYIVKVRISDFGSGWRLSVLDANKKPTGAFMEGVFSRQLNRILITDVNLAVVKEAGLYGELYRLLYDISPPGLEVSSIIMPDRALYPQGPEDAVRDTLVGKVRAEAGFVNHRIIGSSFVSEKPPLDPRVVKELKKLYQKRSKRGEVVSFIRVVEGLKYHRVLKRKREEGVLEVDKDYLTGRISKANKDFRLPLDALISPKSFESRSSAIKVWDGKEALSPLIKESDVIIFGEPDDRGVLRNLGRPGAKEAPTAVMKQLLGMTKEGEVNAKVIYIGDLKLRSSIEDTYTRAEAVVGKILQANPNATIVAIGGDHGFAHFNLYPFNGKRSKVIADAHPDARKTDDPQSGREQGPNSGTSVYLDVTRGRIDGRGLFYFGLNPATELFGPMKKFLEENNLPDENIYSLKDVMDACEREKLDELINALFGKAMATLPDLIAVSVDIDVVKREEAPGRSARNIVGVPAAAVVKLARAAGSQSKVQLFEISEIAPALDKDGRTVDLGARALKEFLIGFSGRHINHPSANGASLGTGAENRIRQILAARYGNSLEAILVILDATGKIISLDLERYFPPEVYQQLLGSFEVGAGLRPAPTGMADLLDFLGAENHALVITGETAPEALLAQIASGRTTAVIHYQNEKYLDEVQSVARQMIRKGILTEERLKSHGYFIHLPSSGLTVEDFLARLLKGRSVPFAQGRRSLGWLKQMSGSHQAVWMAEERVIDQVTKQVIEKALPLEIQDLAHRTKEGRAFVDMIRLGLAVKLAQDPKELERQGYVIQVDGRYEITPHFIETFLQNAYIQKQVEKLLACMA